MPGTAKAHIVGWVERSETQPTNCLPVVPFTQAGQAGTKSRNRHPGAGQDSILAYTQSFCSHRTLDPGFRRDDEMKCMITAR